MAKQNSLTILTVGNDLRGMTMIAKPKSWQRSELQQIQTDSMDVERLKTMLANIENSIASNVNQLDAKKLRELKAFFEKELKNRGQ